MYAYLKRKAQPLPPNLLLGILFAILAIMFGYVAYKQVTKPPVVTDFASCVSAGQPIINDPPEPEQCTYNGQSYIKGNNTLNR
jgi:4-hydroxybenzoate polyprenyltransferase